MPPTRPPSPLFGSTPTRSRGSSTERIPQSATEMASVIEAFLKQHPDASVLEDGKAAFAFGSAKWTVSDQHGRCTLHLWSEERNLVRRVLATAEREGRLRLSSQRLGQKQPKLLELCPAGERRATTTLEAGRERFLKLLERVLEREFAPWKPEGFRTAMDLERSFGPAYARGSLVRGREAWAVIGVGAQESASTIDGVLTLGILWLNECRARAGGKRLYTGLRVVVPEGQATLTHSRLPWLNQDAAQWELFEFDEREERLVARDPLDQGNLRTALVHRPDQGALRERFAEAADQVQALVPPNEWSRVEQHLRSSTELVFLLHGLQFARARVVPEEASFRHRLQISVGAGAAEQLLSDRTRELAREHIAELFRRRRLPAAEVDFGGRGLQTASTSRAPDRRIGSGVLRGAHRRTLPGQRSDPDALPPAQDPLFRAIPERWLESVLRADLAPLTRNLAPSFHGPQGHRGPDGDQARRAGESRLIPRLDPNHVYSQVPAIAGASDRGLLDLLGVTADGRLAVIELKTEDDLHFALQGLDYWVRIRQHHRASADSVTGLGELQRHGYFKDVELSPLAPRLYLVAPALHVHPATETVLRYLSPEVEWHLLALDERWRQTVRVVWRKSGGRTGSVAKHHAEGQPRSFARQSPSD